MYSGHGFRSSEIGDVDVLRHDGLFHLFHLVLPNHDYIAHAVSEDGLTWRRVENALFISDPGSWDDDMLWTMHVTPDPHRPGEWRMFYTGLCLREQGFVQRVGLARSRDLYRWEKHAGDGWPLEIPGDHYEHSIDEGRRWVSFRDPFYFRHDGVGYLIASARAKWGPIIRRGCVALACEEEPNRFEFRPPLYHPQRYDDVEVPSLFTVDGRFYLIGSIREDVKVHYWYADDLQGPYRNFADNVLLPQGNYAARIWPEPSRDAVLIWNFFFADGHIHGDRLLPPPKEIQVDESGELHLGSYRGFDREVLGRLRGDEIAPPEPIFGNPGARREGAGKECQVQSESGLEAFLLAGSHRDFRLSGIIDVETSGKFGLVLHLDEEGDGYYLSLDLTKGIAQIRFWGTNPVATSISAFDYRQLQASHFVPRPGPTPFLLISFGRYIELSLYGEVILTLADARQTEGRVGFYVESCRLRIRELHLERLKPPPEDPYRSQDPSTRRTGA